VETDGEHGAETQDDDDDYDDDESALAVNVHGGASVIKLDGVILDCCAWKAYLICEDSTECCTFQRVV
jgi:hypothetical protein